MDEITKMNSLSWLMFCPWPRPMILKVDCTSMSSEEFLLLLASMPRHYFIGLQSVFGFLILTSSQDSKPLAGSHVLERITGFGESERVS